MISIREVSKSYEAGEYHFHDKMHIYRNTIIKIFFSIAKYTKNSNKNNK